MNEQSGSNEQNILGNEDVLSQGLADAAVVENAVFEPSQNDGAYTDPLNGSAIELTRIESGLPEAGLELFEGELETAFGVKAASTSAISSDNYAVFAEGKLVIKGSSDFDGDPINPRDDAYIYGAEGFDIKSNSTFPVLRNDAGEVILNDNGKQQLLDGAVVVADGYSKVEAKATQNNLSGLIPPQIVEAQTLEIPAYEDLVADELAKRIPPGTEPVIFNTKQNKIKNATDWNNLFPPGGTVENPTYVRVTGGQLDIPNNVDLSNYTIKVDSGDVKFKGSNNELDNVLLQAEDGKLEAKKLVANNVSILASDKIDIKSESQFTGENLIANASGKIEFKSSVTTPNENDSLRVISADDVELKSSSNLRGQLLSRDDLNVKGQSTFYGKLGAKGDITFDGGVEVYATSLQPEATIDSVTVTEGDTGTVARLNVSLSDESSSVVSVDYATVDGTAVALSDYQTTTGTLAFEPGETSSTIEVPVVGDNVYEADEAFTVSLTNPDGVTLNNDTATVKIVNDDELPGITVASVEVIEANATAEFTLSLSNPNSRTVTVDYATVDGTALAGSDYLPSSGTLTFAPGETSKTVAVELIDDSIYELTEAFTLDLSNPSSAAVASASATATIVENDEPPALSVNSVVVTEGEDTAANFEVTLSQPAAVPVTVEYFLTDSTATSVEGTRARGTITFEPGQISQTIVSIPIMEDNIDELDETYTVELSNPVNATILTSQGTATIEDNDPPPVLSVADSVISEGDDGTSLAVFTVSLDNPSGKEITVDYFTADGSAIAGSDYEATSGTLTFAPGETTKTIEVAVAGDSLDEPNETLSLNLDNANNAVIEVLQATGTIADDDNAPVATVDGVSVVEDSEESTTAIFTVSLNNPSGKEITLDYTTVDKSAVVGEDYQATSGTLTFAPGETSQTIAVNILADSLDEIDEAFGIELSNLTNVIATITEATATITDNDEPPVVAIDNITLTELDEGTSSAVFTVTLDSPSAFEITVDYATVDGTAIAGEDYAAIAGTLTFEPGATSKTIEVAVTGDRVFESDEAFTVNLSNPTFVTIDKESRIGTGTIVNNDLPPLDLSFNLADDTGASNTDNISNNATITGAIANLQGSASLNASFSDSEPTDISDLLAPDGRFTIGIERLRQLNGGDLGDGTYTLQLVATDGQTGEVSESELVFSLDTTAATIDLTTPLASGIHSSKSRLTGSTDASDLDSVTYSLDGGAIQSATVEETGSFSAPLSNNNLEAVSHSVAVTATDIAGNTSSSEVSFEVGDILFSPNETDGWGAKSDSTVILGEQDSYVVETSVPVELGLETNEEGELVGTRTISFEVDAVWRELNAGEIEDRLLVYLVDPTNPDRTLLDNGSEGTPVFSLAGEQADFTPGLVGFDGSRVTIDASSLTEIESGLLVFQLLNQDEDTSNVVTVNNLNSTTDPEGFANPIFPQDNNLARVGGELNLDNLTATTDVAPIFEKVSFDVGTGKYRMRVSLQNNSDDAISRNSVVVFENLPEGVELVDASGTDSNGNPYVNLRPAIRSGGLNAGGISESVEVVFSNSNLVRFPLQTTVLVGSPNVAPVFEPIEDLTVIPGDKLNIPLAATDKDGDFVTYRLESDGKLPTGKLKGDGTLRFAPQPSEIGSYEFTIIATDGTESVSQTVTIDVVADPVSTTRISGVIENVEQEPLAGVPIELGNLQTVTAADGSFTIESDEPLTADTLIVRGEEIGGELVYPYIAEKLPLVLGQEVFAGFNNVIDRPIYLPALDVESGQEIDPNSDTVVTSKNIPEAAVFVEAGSLSTQSGEDFTGTLSITEVPVNLTPAALPENLIPDMVVTIQPGEMLFETPAPLNLPNLTGHEPGTQMDLWSIDPETGDFDNVGTGVVSDDGSAIETVSGGIRNSSWHFFAPPPETPDGDNDRQPDNTCNECQGTVAGTSEVELHSGAVIETHELVPYSSLGSDRSLTLTYDSLRADPRPIVNFGFSDVSGNFGPSAPFRLVAELSIKGDNFEYQVPGYEGGQYGFNGGEHFWTLPNNGTRADAALQADLSAVPTGFYQYELDSGLGSIKGGRFNGSTSTTEGEILHVNSIGSNFGNGWGLSGLEEIIETESGDVLIVNGDGGELLFEVMPEGTYQSPAGDFTTLEKLDDGTFRRTTTEQTVQEFNTDNKLASVSDRHDNLTSYTYNADGNLAKIVDPTGLETTLIYNGNLVERIIDPAGRETLLEYDEAGNLIGITDPDGEQRTWEYDDERHMTAEIDKRGNRESAYYDFAGRADRGVLKDGSKLYYDPIQVEGLYPLEATIDPNNAPPVFQLEQELESSYADANGDVTNYQIDGAGQIISSTDGAGTLPTVERNEENLITSQTDARGFEDFYTYDEQGNVLSIREENPSLDGELQSSGTAVDLDGVNDYVQLSNSALVANSANSTVEAWVKFDSFEGAQVIYSEDISGGTIYQLYQNNGSLNFGIWRTDVSGNWTIVSAPLDVELGEWVHVAGILDSTTGMQLYIDGTLVASKVENRRTNANSINSSQIGRVTNNGGREYFQGQIDEVRVWNEARNEVEILNNYQRRVLAFEPNLVGYWNFEEGSGTESVDQTQANRDAILVEGTAWTEDTPELLVEEYDLELVYSEDFESGVGTEWSSRITDNSYPDIFSRFSGRYSNGSQTLTLDTVPGEIYELKFDFYAIDSWDGNVTSVGPDYFNVWIDGQRAFSETISQFSTSQESYQTFRLPDIAKITGTYSSNLNWVDSIYRNIPITFTATDTTTQIRFADGGLQGLIDESWGIDNIEVNRLLFSESQFVERSYTYDPVFNQVSSETDELGRQTLYDIDPDNGNLLSTTEVVGEVGGDDDLVSSYTYTDTGLVDTMTDPLGRMTDYDYDEFGRLIKETFAVGTTDEASIQYEYDDAGNQTAVIDENGNRTEFKYDGLNRLIETTYAVGSTDEATETTEYDEVGNQTATVDGLGNRTEYVYDEQSRLIETVSPDPDGDGELTSPISTSTYDNAGNLIATTDPLGRETRYVYDSRNRLVETILPDGTTTESRYDVDNNLVSTADAAGETTRKTYDARGRLIHEIDPLSKVTRYQYDAANQLVAVVDGNDNRTSYEYDELGRQIAVTDGESNVTRTEYDKAGNVVATIDGNKNRTEYEYDERDRNTSITDAESGTTTTEYDDVGNVISVTDPVNNQTSYTYDARNRVIADTNELGFNRTFEYDDVGNSISTTDRNGRTREFTHDGLNRQIEENWLDEAGDSIRTIDSEYDAASQLIATDDPDSAYDFTYDELGRMETVDNVGTPGVPNVVLTYNYDAEGNIISVSDTIDGEAGATTAYNYDELDRVDRITQFGDNVAEKRVDFDFDAIGQYESITRYSDLSGTELVAQSSYTYDDAYRLTDLIHSNNTTEIANYDLTYDAANRITQIIDADGTNDYSYDKRDQLTTADHSDENNADETYSYDKNGNRTDSSLHGDGYVTDANNRLASDGTYNYEYDNQGNLISQTEIATGNVQEMEWDYRNRLVAVTDKDSSGNETQTVEFTYDMFGKRLSKIVDGEATYFVYDRDNVILDFVDADGIEGEGEAELDKRYLHGERVDQVLAQEDASGDVTWHLADHLGSVRDLVDNDGNTVNHYVYDSFGNVVSQTSETFISRYLFTGREWDDEIGLQFNRGRYYDPELGIFINEDPIGFSGGTPNLYGYVENNPINAIDPFGTTSNELVALLNIAQPRSSNPEETIYRYPKAPDYQTALINATTWFYLITERNQRSGGQINSRIPGLQWQANSPLKVNRPPYPAGGKATLRPAGDSGIEPTIDLDPFPKKPPLRHLTPEKPATEIKFEWIEKKNRCPFIPPIPQLKPNPEPVLEDAPASPLPVPYPSPSPTPSSPWWDNIPTIPLPGWNPFKQRI